MTAHMFATIAQADDTCHICPRFERTFQMLGKKWNGLIISVLCENDQLRFRDLAHAITKCSDRVLVERLKELEEAGIVARYEKEACNSVFYSLTDKGRDLLPVMDEIHRWSDKWS